MFHPEAFYPLGLFALTLGLLRNKLVLVGGGVLLIFAIKEDAVLAILGVALFLILRRRFGMALALTLVGLALYLFASHVLMPAASGSPRGMPWYSQSWSHYGETPLAAAWGMVRRPDLVLRDLWRSGVPSLLEILLWTPLLGGSYLALALPGLLVYGVARHGHGISMFSLYYSTPVLPFLFIAAAIGLRRTALWSSQRLRGRMDRRQLLRLLAVAVFWMCAMDGASYVFRSPDPRRLEVLDLVREAAGLPTLRVQGSLLPYAGYDKCLQPLQEVAISTREGYLLDPETNPYPFEQAELEKLARELAVDARFKAKRGRRSTVLFLPMDGGDGK